MTDHRSISLRLQTVSAVGVALVILGALWLLGITIDERNSIATARAERADGELVTAGIQPSAWGGARLVADDLGTGSSEFSAVAYNESNGRLMIADDGGVLFEFDLDADGMPEIPPRRTIQVGVGAGDIEGIAWMFGTTYVLAHENDGRLTVVEIGDTADTITGDHLVRTIDTGIVEEAGNGVEGVAYLGRGVLEFAVVDEWPPSLQLISSRGDVEQIIPLDLGVPDVSDVWADADGTLMVVSDEARVAIRIWIDVTGEITELGRLSLVDATGRFEQPEGVVGTIDGRRLFVVGESPSEGRFSFGVWTSEPAG